MRLKEEKIMERIALAERNLDFAISMSTAGQFTLNWTTADSTQRQMVYWSVLHNHERERLTGIPYEYWMGYLNALRLVAKIPPDDEVAPEEDYE